MSIIEKQISTITADVTREALRSGQQPSIGAITKAIKEKLEGTPSAPTTKVRIQARKKKFDIDKFNVTMKEISFDLNIAYEELVTIISNTLRRLNLVEVSYKAQSQQLEEIIGVLDNLLFTVANADDNFFGVFDNFENLTKTDQSFTTIGAVDLAEKAVVLPATNTVGRKIDMSHLYNRISWPVTITTDANVVSSQVGASANFGNAFSDITSVWRQDVITERQSPVTIEFDIPISGVSDQEIGINRIQVIPHSSSSMQLRVFTSIDNINFLRIANTDSGIELKRQAKQYNIDFSTTRVQFIRFKITKKTPDSQRSDGTYRYSFGLNHIGFYTLGRQVEAEFRSIPQTPVGMKRPIDKISLRTVEQVAEGADLTYLVALTDSTGKQIGTWRPIEPVNRTISTSAPHVVRFANASRRSIPIVAASGPTISIETFRAITFFTIPKGIAAGDEYIPGTARLFRGFGAWNKNIKQSIVLKQVKDSYITFAGGDIQKIYAVVTNTASPSEAFQTFPGGGLSAVLQTALAVDHIIDYNSITMPLVPPPGVDINIDQRPNYGIYRILRFRSKMTIDLEAVVLNGELPTLLAQAHPTVGLSTRPVVQNNVNPPTITYTEGTDYTVLQDANGRPTGEIARLSDGSIADGDTVLVTYNLNPNITHLADAARDNLIYLNTLLTIDEDDRFEVTYRFVPKVPVNTVIKSTVRVTERFGDAVEGTVYKEGPDYSINPQQGTITRIPAGNIGQQAGDIAVYIDFFYKETPPVTQTYSTWVFQSSKSPISFDFSPLGFDKDGGERMIINTNQNQSVELTDARESPELQFGWHQIVVKSKDPNDFGNAAIKKVISLVDGNNDFIFVRGGKYFSEIQAVRSPMQEVSQHFLKHSVVPTNHNNFAINSDGKVILNFQPGTTDELFLLQPRLDPGNAGADANGFIVDTFVEEFLLEYRVKTAETITGSAVILRVLLNRSPTSDGGITPKLHAYDMKLG